MVPPERRQKQIWTAYVNRDMRAMGQQKKKSMTSSWGNVVAAATNLQITGGGQQKKKMNSIISIFDEQR